MKKFSNSNEPEFRKGLSEEEINSPEFNPDDFAPAPETDGAEGENEGLENKRNSLIFALVATLLAIIVCFAGWGVSASVARYESRVLERHVLSVFDNCDRIELYSADREGYAVYAVFFKDKMAGYAVLGTTEGFGGDIDFVVAFNSNNMISKIRVLDHNESRGLGSKIGTDTFLSQFKGLLIGNVNVKYDLISGATTSSKAMGDAISEILGLGLSTESIANELGYDTISEEEIEEEVKKEEDDKKDPSKETEPAETTGKPRPGVNDHGGANVNTGDGDEDMNIDGEDETTVYETETEEPDETTADTTDKADDTTKAPDTSEKVEDTTGPVDSETEADTTEPPVTDTEPVEDTTDSETSAPTVEDTTDAVVEPADSTDAVAARDDDKEV
ncbi:MAG: FMN-binding protein [Ruminococcaceae bacterium]|nr:FMN-binding protein [Oscillospiraceae bacterium]